MSSYGMICSPQRLLPAVQRRKNPTQQAAYQHDNSICTTNQMATHRTRLPKLHNLKVLPTTDHVQLKAWSNWHPPKPDYIYIAISCYCSLCTQTAACMAALLSVPVPATSNLSASACNFKPLHYANGIPAFTKDSRPAMPMLLA